MICLLSYVDLVQHSTGIKLLRSHIDSLHTLSFILSLSTMPPSSSLPRFNPRSWIKTPARYTLPNDRSVLPEDFTKRHSPPFAFDRPIFSDGSSFQLPEFTSHIVYNENNEPILPASTYPQALAMWIPSSLTSNEYTFHEGWLLHDSVLSIYREFVPLLVYLARQETEVFSVNLAAMVEDHRHLFVRNLYIFTSSFTNPSS